MEDELVHTPMKKRTELDPVDQHRPLGDLGVREDAQHNDIGCHICMYRMCRVYDDPCHSCVEFSNFEANIVRNEEVKEKWTQKP